MIRIDGASPQTLSQQPDSRTSTATGGAWKGETLQLMDTSRSVLGDAAEEISMHIASEVDSKRLDERKAEPESRIDLKKIEEITRYLDEMHGKESQAKLEEAAKRLLHGKRDGFSPRDEARRSFEDVTEQYLALSYAVQRGQEEGVAPERLEAIRDAIAELEDDFGPRIRAGLAAAAGARELGVDATGARQFRDTYRDVVLGKGDLVGTFDELVQKHGIEDFPRVLPALIKALGEDLQSVRPSREPERMQAIVQDLYNLEVATTVLEQARELSATVAKAARV